MRKQILIPLLLCLLLLAVCIGTQLPDRIEKSIVNEKTYEAPVGPYAVVTVGDETCEPYFNGLSFKIWSEAAGYFSVGDSFRYLPANLDKIADDLPVITYGRDLAIDYRSDVTINYINIYDEGISKVAYSETFPDLADLPDGRYYVIIAVRIQGKYIKEADDYESTGGDLVFVLDKH